MSYAVALVGINVVAVVGIAALLLLRDEAGRRRGTLIFGALALLAALAWGNFGLFHGAGFFVHPWEQFHYALGAKYFEEVGYDGLYVASLEAQVETMPGLPLPLITRDLRNNWLVSTPDLREHAEEVKARFSPERWDSFLHDHAVHVTMAIGQFPREHLAEIRRDHGFHATPSWIVLARLFGAEAPASPAMLGLYGAIDLLLLGVAFLVVLRTYGARTACVAALIFGTGHAWAFYWIGGSFLRMDWFVAVVLAACAARTGRMGVAGALLGVASATRLFPAVLVLGPAMSCLRAWRHGHSRAPMLRLVAGTSLGLGIGLAAGCFTGRGAAAWPEFASSIGRHQQTWLSNNVGLRDVVAYDPSIVIRGDDPKASVAWGDRLDRAMIARRPLMLALAGGFLLLVAAAAFRLEPDQALVISIVAVFALANLTCYYWIMLTLVALRPGRWMPVVVLALAVAGRALEAAGTPAESLYGGLSWALAVAFVAWLLPDALSTVRGLRETETPVHASGQDA